MCNRILPIPDDVAEAIADNPPGHQIGQQQRPTGNFCSASRLLSTTPSQRPVFLNSEPTGIAGRSRSNRKPMARSLIGFKECQTD